MQGKVSMVMPCYNKIEYIGEMFDSIIAQEWDNIELILVNDGSTDGTLEAIFKYEPKFRERGYEVVIIGQKNAGVCAAAKAGLEHITGDYVCIVDADDELDPKYVSTLAGWLENHSDYDYTVCDHMTYTGSGGSKVFSRLNYILPESECPNIAEKFLLSEICGATWTCLTRTDYLRRCRITENYYTETRGSHEPSFMLPITAYGGKFKAFNEPLYHFNLSDVNSHSRQNHRAANPSYERVYMSLRDYMNLSIHAINQLPGEIANDEKRKRLVLAGKGRYLSQCVFYTFVPGGDEIKTCLADEIVRTVNEAGLFSFSVKLRVTSGYEPFIKLALERAFWKEPPLVFQGKHRVIGYGVLGRAASKLLPLLNETQLDPTELWDAAGDDISVKKPDFNSLHEKDFVLVFPTGQIEAQLRKQFCNVPFCTIYNSDIRTWIADSLFVQV